jgi:thiamine-monophosphate kinase
LRRRRGHAGDWLVVGGWLGEAAAGLAALEHGLEQEFSGLVRAQRRPMPQLALGRWLAAHSGCHGAMDLSDGLAVDLPRFVGAEQGATLDGERLPVSNELKRLAVRLGVDPSTWAMSGGEDFVLLAAIAHDGLTEIVGQARERGFSLFAIGQIDDRPGCRLRYHGQEVLWPAGFDHFG